MTGRHSLNATRHPRWAVRAWARLDHARFVRRYGQVVEDWREAAYYRRLSAGITDGAVADGERQTIRAVR